MKNLIRVIVAMLIVGAVAAYIKFNRNQQARLPKTQDPACMHNLKAIGLAFRVWAIDHNDEFPFNKPASEGGTLEQAQVDSEGFAIDPAAHFRPLAISEDLRTPLVLRCPKDRARKAAVEWPALTSENVTYKLRVGTNVTEGTKQVLVVCPIDGNTVYADGTFVGETEKIAPGEPQPMRAPQ